MDSRRQLRSWREVAEKWNDQSGQTLTPETARQIGADAIAKIRAEMAMRGIRYTDMTRDGEHDE
jgi:hypothetical protein